MNSDNFTSLIHKIATQDNYNDNEKWTERGLQPSSLRTKHILHQVTQNFLSEIEVIGLSGMNKEEKLTQINALVDKLPWDELDTEEKEFLSDVLAPVIQASGFDPQNIF
jgi:hypothetical protein